jgi:hypothetical protein
MCLRLIEDPLGFLSVFIPPFVTQLGVVGGNNAKSERRNTIFRLTLGVETTF